MVQKVPILYSGLVYGMSLSKIKLARCHRKDFGTSGNHRTQYKLQSCGTHVFVSPGYPLIQLAHRLLIDITVDWTSLSIYMRKNTFTSRDALFSPTEMPHGRHEQGGIGRKW